ncbi:2-dehydropantoate 2-reductase [Roseomonas sp. M0104]|uniref:2-dehydropantoate 2-reductase n=1 Tax=Teichococcus coralli TaxID=2545983 RepID=A0A845BD79_9PROT|nr:2-dehydropantoate 2-reductase [Pseudoroseomonas coralli]MXP64865.1 2-dehydropantoate 2-reductase [Pseudoroseomonas coralli]
MRILVLGAGALGGYYGSRLLEAGADLAFLVRARRQEQLRRNGLVVHCPVFGTTQRAVTALQAQEVQPGWDLVLLTCKAYDLQDAIAAIRPAIGPETAILPVLNGIAHVARLREAFGEAAVLGGVARIAATLTPEGEVRNLGQWRTLTVGELNGRITPRVTDFVALAAKGGIQAEAAPDIRGALWAKLVMLGTLAGATVLMRGTVGQILRAPGGPGFLRSLLERNAAIAAHHGAPLAPKVLETIQDIFADPASKLTASMLRDLEGGGRIESDAILGELLEGARRAGIDPALHELIMLHARTYEQRRAEEAGP